MTLIDYHMSLIPTFDFLLFFSESLSFLLLFLCFLDFFLLCFSGEDSCSDWLADALDSAPCSSEPASSSAEPASSSSEPSSSLPDSSSPLPDSSYKSSMIWAACVTTKQIKSQQTHRSLSPIETFSEAQPMRVYLSKHFCVRGGYTALLWCRYIHVCDCDANMAR